MAMDFALEFRRRKPGKLHSINRWCVYRTHKQFNPLGYAQRPEDFGKNVFLLKSGVEINPGDGNKVLTSTHAITPSVSSNRRFVQRAQRGNDLK
jgi:hypothetical protein